MVNIFNAMQLKNILPFISTWDTTKAGSANTHVVLPFVSTGSYNCVINWGDGNSSVVTAYNDAALDHTYSVSGTYTIAITGLCTGFSFANSGDCAKLMTITQWGNLKLGNNNSYFYGCANLTITATDILNLAGTASLFQAFRSCSSLTTVPNMQLWNTANVTSMASMFNGCTVFNQSISGFNTAKVTTMVSMFLSCAAFNQSVSSFNTAAVTSMSSMFSGCAAFNQSVSSFNTAAVTNMGAMFNGCTIFNQSVSSFNTANVISMAQMFLSCPAFNQSVSSFNTANVTLMNSVFQNCTVFNQSVSNFNTAKVTTMNNMFNSCTAFNQDVSGFSIAALTGATNMFASSGFTITNYNLLLDSVAGWPSQGTINNGVAFSAGTAHYSGVNAIAGRAILVTTHTWVVSDGGTP